MNLPAYHIYVVNKEWFVAAESAESAVALIGVGQYAVDGPIPKCSYINVARGGMRRYREIGEVVDSWLTAGAALPLVVGPVSGISHRAICQLVMHEPRPIAP